MDAKHGMEKARTIERIPIPRIDRPTPEEIERRRALSAEVVALREKIGPIGIPADELLRHAREDTDDEWYECDE